MNESTERKTRESEKVILEALEDIRTKQADHIKATGEIQVALFGPPKQEWMGFIPRTEVRIDALEKRFWHMAVGVITTMAAAAYHWLAKSR